MEHCSARSLAPCDPISLTATLKKKGIQSKVFILVPAVVNNISYKDNQLYIFFFCNYRDKDAAAETTEKPERKRMENPRWSKIFGPLSLLLSDRDYSL